jgi:CHRD domain
LVKEVEIMSKRFVLTLVLGMLLALVLGSQALAGGRPLTTTLTGAAEVPGPGDPDGTGTATITVNLGQEEVCWEINAAGIVLPAAAAHIHVGAAGEAGPVVVPLSAPDAMGFSSGCATVDRDLAKAILKNPEDYYVNVHTSEFPAGAIRGQLSK